MQAARAQQAAVHAAVAGIALAYVVRDSTKTAANDSTIHSRVQLRGISDCKSKLRLISYAPCRKCKRHLLLCECRDHCMAVFRRDRQCIRRCWCSHTKCPPCMQGKVSALDALTRIRWQHTVSGSMTSFPFPLQSAGAGSEGSRPDTPIRGSGTQVTVALATATPPAPSRICTTTVRKPPVNANLGVSWPALR